MCMKSGHETSFPMLVRTRVSIGSFKTGPFKVRLSFADMYVEVEGLFGAFEPQRILWGHAEGPCARDVGGAGGGADPDGRDACEAWWPLVRMNTDACHLQPFNGLRWRYH